MKSVSRRVLSLTVVLCLLLAPLSPGLAAAGEYVYENVQTLLPGLTLTSTLRRTDAGAADQYFTLDYTPGLTAVPITAYGNEIYGKSDINTVVNWCQNQGYTVMAAVNGDFFDMNTGVPTGMVIQNGRLCVSDGAWNAVGFLSDGSVITGAPALQMSLTDANGLVRPIYALNKVRTQKGIYLYTSDYSSTTRLTAAGVQVVLDLTPGDYLRLGQPLIGTVSQVVHGTEALPLRENQVILALSDVNTSGTTLGGIEVGQTITINAWTSDTRWHDAVFSCGGGDMLLKNGQLTSAATTSKAPRTVLGTRDDGSCVILVCDGRQTGLADGISLRDAALQLQAQGCTNVVNLDGGGSTIIASRANGEQTVPVISSPSDGSARKCANFIVFVNGGNQTLPASTVAVYPQDEVVMAGAQVTLSSKSFNPDYFPTSAYAEGFTVTSGGGSVEGNVFTAPAEAGVVTVGALSSTMTSQDAVFTVYETPPFMSVVRHGSRTAVTSLSLSPNEQVDLDVLCSDGVRDIVSQDSIFTFTLEGNAGTITPDGLLTAGSAPGLSGTLTVSAGSKTVSIPITVGQAPDLLEGFENGVQWVAAAAHADTSVACTISQSPENARYGFGSASLTYHVPLASLPETITYYASAPYTLGSGANAISLMVRGSGNFALDFRLSNGSTVSVPLTLAATSEWQYVTASVPSGATALLGLSSSVAEASSGSVLIDQILCHYTGAEADLTPPSVTLAAEGTVLTGLITDNYPLPITSDMISLTLDGQALAFEYLPQTGELTANLPDDGAMHHIVLTVYDAFFNRTMQSITVGSIQTGVYQDLAPVDHWATEYAEYLCTQGVFSQDINFYPDRAATNQEVATLISRYLGLDVSQYASVALPFADQASIADWALPHVRALYAEGIMRGTVVDGVSLFQPTASTTRAQVMTVIGRTIERGYSYTTPAFDDFASVPYWAQDHISLLTSLGVVSGFGNTNNVAPLESITRGQLASIFFKLY